jgi:hypothetical protein
MRKQIDLAESYEGDLIIEAGDLKDTSADPARTYYQIIRTLLMSLPGENKIYPSLGIDLSPYVGSANNRHVGMDIAKVIKDKISEVTNLFSGEIDITPYPIGINSIAFRIRLLTVDSNEKGITVVYDSKDNLVNSLYWASRDVKPTTIITTASPVTIGA